MSGLVNFDQAGALGPTVTLLFNVNRYSRQGLEDLTEVVKANYMNLAGKKAKGRKEFCQNALVHIWQRDTISPLEVVHSRFFTDMTYQGETLPYHDKVVNVLVPGILKTIRDQIIDIQMDDANTEEVSEWLAGFLESYLTPEQVHKISASFENDKGNDDVRKLRNEIAIDLYDQALKGNVKQEHVDALVKVSACAVEMLTQAKEVALASAAEEGKSEEEIQALKDGFSIPMEYAGRYLTLFAKSNDPEELCSTIMTNIQSIFQEKFAHQGTEAAQSE